jgi:hypothetical protein
MTDQWCECERRASIRVITYATGADLARESRKIPPPAARQRAQFFGRVLCFLWVLRKCCDLTDVLGSRSGFTAVHAPPSHLLWSLNELFALDAAKDALGAARKAKSTTAAATPIFLTMVILPLAWDKIARHVYTNSRSIYIYKSEFART